MRNPLSLVFALLCCKLICGHLISLQADDDPTGIKIKLELKINQESKRDQEASLEELELASEPIDLWDLELSPEVLFEEFSKQYSKEYENEAEKIHRFSIFKENLLTMKERNADPQNGAEYRIDQFADQRLEEYGGGAVLGDYYSEADFDTMLFDDNVTGIPDSFDWRQRGAVASVKNQGSCGSCWTFSSAGVIEGAYARKHNQLLEFSEQQLLDCERSGYGCGGGSPASALRLAKSGIELYGDYPYKGYVQACQFNVGRSKAYVQDIYNIQGGNEDAIKKAVYQYGPVSIILTSTYFNGYRGGILNVDNCPYNPSHQHAVLIVGYGVDGNTKWPYWIVKNSWGSGFGYGGYIYIYRGKNVCQLANWPVTATVQ